MFTLEDGKWSFENDDNPIWVPPPYAMRPIRDTGLLCAYHDCILAFEAQVQGSADNSWELRRFYARPRCRYCRHKLSPFTIAAQGLNRLQVKVCPHCGWWKLVDYVWAFIVESSKYLIGQARSYDVAALDPPIDLLRKFLARHPNNLAHVNPTSFEKLMQECLQSEYPGSEVVHLGQSHDGGIDLKLVTSQQDVFLVQVKRRADLTRREGVGVVRALNGVLFREGKTRGIVITTARDFTHEARAETKIKTPTRAGVVIKLLAFDDVVRMLGLPAAKDSVYKPWAPYLGDDQKDIKDYFWCLDEFV